ncbi:unnamed protein product, partial [Amoebophrya sp. A120]
GNTSITTPAARTEDEDAMIVIRVTRRDYGSSLSGRIEEETVHTSSARLLAALVVDDSATSGTKARSLRNWCQLADEQKRAAGAGLPGGPV